jgi:hypothetical protein
MHEPDFSQSLLPRLSSENPTSGTQREEIMLSRLKRMLVAVMVASLLLLGMTAAPAFAFIHEFIPAGACAASDQAGDNETAEAHLPRVPIQTPPAPDICPAPQK